MELRWQPDLAPGNRTDPVWPGGAPPSCSQFCAPGGDSCLQRRRSRKNNKSVSNWSSVNRCVHRLGMECQRLLCCSCSLTASANVLVCFRERSPMAAAPETRRYSVEGCCFARSRSKTGCSQLNYHLQAEHLQLLQTSRYFVK